MILQTKVYKKLVSQKKFTVKKFMTMTKINDEKTLTELLIYGYGQLILRDIEETAAE